MVRTPRMAEMPSPEDATATSRTIAQLRDRIGQAPPREREELGAWLRKLQRRRRSGQPIDRSLARIEKALARAEAARTARARAVDRTITYPAELPVVARREEIAELIRTNQVVVVCGETGSGKTTQLPKLCLELGRGVEGRIGHTQPRRIAARSVAERIARELETEPGEVVGWQVRFTKEVGAGTAIKLMTDGILLAETEHDPDLRAYDTIIIDEAHERSLNIDFLLGYLRRLLPRRPDLKVVVTSATIDAERFSRHFGDCPVVEVGGRTHPVEIRWRPLEVESEGGEPPSPEQEVRDAVLELLEELPEGDVLVFLPGEREIREAIDQLEGPLGDRVELLPLYARLSSQEQQRVFSQGERRRVVFATNVAETSVTVPGIRAVVDTGRARISRYSARSRVQRLPIEQISRASAVQRAGRCGRIGPGVCIRLYSEEVFESSEPFTQPEILRSNLASVILRMLALGLGAIDAFPFLDRPSGRLVEEGWATLFELGAVDRARELTASGRSLARLPIDPRIGRMLVTAAAEHCLPETLVVAAVLTTQDPRLRPFGGEQNADLAHAVWRDQKSDFLGFLQIWQDLREHLAEHGSSATRRWCRERFLSWVRVREWMDTWRQLRELAAEVFETRIPAEVARRPRDGGWGALHRSVLSGLVSNLGRLDEDRTYETVNGGRYALHPSSGLLHRRPPWVVAAEIVETTRRYGRICAKVRGDWVERVAPHLLRSEYEEPHYLPDSGQVAAWERVHFGSLVVIPRRRVPYGPIDREVARDVFIHEALVEERLRTRAPFLARNRELRQRIEAMEEKGRRRDLLVGSEARFAFYDRRLPAHVHNAPGFERWRARAERETPELLVMRESDLLREGDHAIDRESFPDALGPAGSALTLRYHHEPGADPDGVSLEVPLAGLVQLDPLRLDWLVPGLLAEKIEQLIRSLPKRLRTRFSPIREVASGAAEALEFGVGDLHLVLSNHLTRLAGIDVLPGDFDRERLPDHLRMRLVLRDDEGRELASSRDLDRLRRDHAAAAGEAFARRLERHAGGLERSGLLELPEEPLPLRVELPSPYGDLPAFPALVDEGATLGIRLLPERLAAEREHARGVRRALLEAARPSLVGHLDWLLEGRDLTVAYAPLGDARGFREQLELLVIDAVFLADHPEAGTVRDRTGLERRLDAGFGELASRAERVVDAVESAVLSRNRVLVGLDRPMPGGWSEAVEDIRREVLGVLPAAFSEPGWHRMREAPRRLDALERRLIRLGEKGPARDQRDRETLEPWVLRLERARALHPGGRSFAAYELAVDELRIHLAAPALAVSGAASPKRLQAAWDRVRAEAPQLFASLP